MRIFPFGRRPGLGRARIAPRRRLGLAIAAIGCLYMAYPYVTLYRLGHALQHGDVPYLKSSIDWDSVRAGISQDVADAMMGRKPGAGQLAAAQPATDDLPAFGASFASSVAVTAVNQDLTPDLFAASLSAGASSGESSHSDLDATRLSWAFFTGPTTFVADLNTADGAPVKLRMDMVGTRWKLTRAWLPPEMLANHHT